MADNDDHEISRQVVGAMRGIIKPAHRAVIVHFQEGPKQFPLAATRATSAQAPLESGPKVTFLTCRGFPGPDLCRLVHGFHDLPFFDLLLLRGLRSFLRGLRPGCALAGVSREIPASFGVASRRRPRGITRPSDNSSNRSAPATGAASTRRTATTSPSRCMAPLREPTSAWRASS